MRNRLWFSLSAWAVVMAAVLWAPTFTAAQTQSGAGAKTTARTDTKAAASTKDWTTPRTPDGKPDLHGHWISTSFTPSEPPAKDNGKEYFTAQAAETTQKEGLTPTQH